MIRGLRTTFKFFSKRSALGAFVFAVILLSGVVGVSVHAQWVEPLMPVPVNPGDPDVDDPLYAGSDALYGGMAQSRSGPLTIGSSTTAPGSTLSVFGRSLISQSLGVMHAPTNDSAVSVSSGSGYGISASSLSSTGAGIVGALADTLGSGGIGIHGDARFVVDAAGAYGYSAGGAGGNLAAGLYAVNPTSDAGRFDGIVKFAHALGALPGTLQVQGDGSFGDNVTVTNTVSAYLLTLAGVNFDPRTVNAKSVQDQSSASPITNPGISSFVLTSSSNPCKVGGVACSGLIANGSTAEWNLGPLATGGTGFFSNKRRVVQSYVVEYSYDNRVFQRYNSANFQNPKFEQCTQDGNSVIGKFSIVNDVGAAAHFRIIVLYKDNPAGVICNPGLRWRHITVPASYQGDTVMIKLTDATTPLASDIYNASGIADELHIYWNGTEISRHVVSYTSTDIEVWFKVQVQIDSPDALNYILVYGDPAPPLTNLNDVYLLWDDFSGASFDLAKWSTYNFNRVGVCLGMGEGSNAAVSGGYAQIVHTHNSCWSGASFFTANPYPKIGYYTMDVLWNPELSDSAGIDGIFFRNPTVDRDNDVILSGDGDVPDTLGYYGAPNDYAFTVALGNSCNGGISLWSDNADFGSSANNYQCGAGWGSRFSVAGNCTGNQQYCGTYLEGTDYPLRVLFDTISGNSETLQKGVVYVQQPAGTQRIRGTMSTSHYNSLGTDFVIEMHDGYAGSDTTAEKYDNFLLRRGRDGFSPSVSVDTVEQF